MVEFGGDKVTVSEMIKAAASAKGITKKEVAAFMGWSAQNFANRLRNNTISGEEWLKIASYLGYEVKMYERDSGEELKTRKRGIGPRVRQRVNNVNYDTFKADALCHTEEEFGWFLELYRDSQGRLFVVHYTSWTDGVNLISPVGFEDAKKLYEQFGDGTEDTFFGIEEQ